MRSRQVRRKARPMRPVTPWLSVAASALKSPCSFSSSFSFCWASAARPSSRYSISSTSSAISSAELSSSSSPARS